MDRHSVTLLADYVDSKYPTCLRIFILLLVEEKVRKWLVRNLFFFDNQNILETTNQTQQPPTRVTRTTLRGGTIHAQYTQ